MNYHKKITAFITSLLICMSVSPCFSFADDEENINSDDEIMLINLEDEETEVPTEEASMYTVEKNDDDMIESGGFTYTVDDDGNAHIVSCDLDDEEIAIPDEIDGIKVTEIESKTFLKGTFKKISIPESIEYISSDNPFAPCLELTEITVDEKNKNYCSVDGVLFSKDMKKLLSYPAGKSAASFTVPDGVEKIGIAAISDTSLKEIILPASVNEISRHAFSFNEKLEKLDMSSTTVKMINTMAFANCTSLKDFTFSESTTKIDIAAFIGCESLEEVELPSNLEYVEQSAFMGAGLKKIRIPETVSYIGYSAFGYDINDNPNPNFIIIGEAGSVAQRYSSDKDSEYDYTNNFTFITTETFEAEETYNAMNPVSSGDYEYSVIDDEACILFCVSIDETITVPEELDGYKVTSIYKGAFLKNEAKNIIFPETLKKIDEAVFSEYVESITLPAGLMEISGEEPFLSCTSLKEITVTEGEGGEYSSQDGVLYNKDKTVLIAYPVKKEDTKFTVPSTVKEILISAFCNNIFIENVDFSNVEKINNYAFEGCSSLNSVTFSDKLTFVGSDVFLDDKELKSVRLPSSLENIGDYAFGYYFDSALAAQLEENSEELPFSVIDGFKIYAEEESLGWKYAKACKIEVVTNTVEIGEKNVDKNFLYVIGGSVGAAAIIGSCVALFKGKKKKKGGKK